MAAMTPPLVALERGVDLDDVLAGEVAEAGPCADPFDELAAAGWPTGIRCCRR
jgi:hypothetical protein